jgi:hypothetical protein
MSQMSLACIGTSGRGEVVMLVSLCPSKFEVLMVVRILQSEGVKESEMDRRLVSIYGQNVFSWK